MDKNKSLNVIAIKGSSKYKIHNGNIKSIIWTKHFGDLISSSRLMISEAGYFTMLDLINYKKKAILIPGKRIIGNQEIKALKLQELGIGKVFFPFEKSNRLSNLIIQELEDKQNKFNDRRIYKSISNIFGRYPRLGKVILKEIK